MYFFIYENISIDITAVSWRRFGWLQRSSFLLGHPKRGRKVFSILKLFLFQASFFVFAQEDRGKEEKERKKERNTHQEYQALVLVPLVEE